MEGRKNKAKMERGRNGRMQEMMQKWKDAKKKKRCKNRWIERTVRKWKDAKKVQKWKGAKDNGKIGGCKKR